MNINITVDPDLKELFPSYLEKRKNEFKSLPDWVASSEFKKIEVLGHQISGNAGMFGMDELGAKAQLLEQAAKKSDAKAILKISAEILSYLQQVRLSH